MPRPFVLATQEYRTWLLCKHRITHITTHPTHDTYINQHNPLHTSSTSYLCCIFCKTLASMTKSEKSRALLMAARLRRLTATCCPYHSCRGRRPDVDASDTAEWCDRSFLDLAALGVGGGGKATPAGGSSCATCTVAKVPVPIRRT